jgi:CheY-like chemotaxis protein
MFVDDEALLALAAEASLQAEGYDVAIAFDGEEALSKAIDFAPDIVLTDLMMPRLDGAGLARGLASNGIAAPVVVLTAVPESDLPAETRRLFSAYLGKPLQDETLFTCISTLVG